MSAGVMPKSTFTACDACHDAKREARWLAMPVVEWGEFMAYDFNTDRWFDDEDAFADHYDQEEIDPSTARLVASEPVYAWMVDPIREYEDKLPEDGDIPSVIIGAFATLNAIIREEKAVLCYEPIDKRILPPVSEEATNS